MKSQTCPLVVILANGDFPRNEAARRYFDSADQLVCCDGATEKALAAGREPDAIVGDLDSLSPELLERFRDRTRRVAEQETNDLAKAFRFCVEKKWTKNVVILGATGGREDHTLGNVARLAQFAQTSPNIRLATNDGWFEVALRSRRFDATPGRQISIFSFDPNQEITSRGLKYPLNGLKLKTWADATLNEALGAEFSLAFDGASPLLVFFANEIKKNKSAAFPTR